MKTFDEIWALLAPEGEFKRRRGCCERLWQSLEAGRQEAVYERIAGKLQRGEFVNQNPYFAIEDNAAVRAPRQLMLTMSQYYERYNTTAETDGWRQANPTGNQVIYIKNN